jgi:fumarate reductase flavoprotein subunit
MKLRSMNYISFFIMTILISGLFIGCAKGNSKDYDVVVVGAGAAGLAAAIEAAEAGANVALLEKLPMVGGSAVLSGGLVYSTGSQAQKDAGIEDSVEDLVNYWSERADGKADIDFLTFVAEKSGATMDWLVDCGVKFSDALLPVGTSPVLRAQQTPEHGGLIIALKAYAESKNVDFFVQTSANELIVNDEGLVTGVKALDKEENEIIFNAKSTVLATGGFDRNPDLKKEYSPIAEYSDTFVGMGNTGDGLIMAKEIGADVVTKGGVIGFRKVVGEPAYTTDICYLMFSPYLYVNKLGERFVNEAIDYPLFYEELVKQEDQVSYLIFDGNTFVEPLDRAVEKGSAFVAESLEELANQSGIDSVGLVSTVDKYNEMIEDGKDTEFGKALTGLTKIDTPKYYALKVIPATVGTMGGVKIDLDTQVINTDGNIIKGLYAAGEVANGSFFNQVYPATGTSLQMCFTFGRVAGQKAAAFAKN